MSTDFVTVLTTLPADADTESFARTLIDERLAACVNVLPPMTSTYRWEGKVEVAAERQVVIKTAASRVDALSERLHALHPYETPEFVVIAIADGAERYLQWIRESVDA